MRRILVVLAALLALSTAPAFAAQRAGAFRADTVIRVCLASEEAQAERQAATPEIPEPFARPVSKVRMIVWAETDTRFQRPPPAV